MRSIFALFIIIISILPTASWSANCFARLYNHTNDAIKVTYKGEITTQSGKIDTLAPNQQGAIVWLKDWESPSQKAFIILTNIKTQAQCMYLITANVRKVRTPDGDVFDVYNSFDMKTIENGTHCAPSEGSVNPGSGFNLDIRQS